MTRTMFNVNLDRSGPVAPYDQVATQIRRAIADGKAPPGQRLPLAKDLAAVLGVNQNTVLRAAHPARGRAAGILPRTRHQGGGHTRARRGSRSRQEPAGVRPQQRYGHSEIIRMINDLPRTCRRAAAFPFPALRSGASPRAR